MNLKSLLIAIGTLVVLVLIWNMLFTVHETQRAILLRFGAVQQADLQPGLHWKLPIADEVKKFNGKVLTVDAPPERYFTSEQKPLMVDSFAKWRIGDVERYYTSTSGDETRARDLLKERVSEGLRNQISRRDMHEVISGERDQLMLELTTSLNEVMAREMGVRVIDVRVKRIDLPAEVEDAVYQRMNSAREIEAKQYRASGDEKAIGIRAGCGSAGYRHQGRSLPRGGRNPRHRRCRIGADLRYAFNKDPEFYAFYRRVTAYSKVFSGKEDQLVLDPDSDLLQIPQDRRPIAGSSPNSRPQRGGGKHERTQRGGHRHPMGVTRARARSSTCSPNVPPRWCAFKAATMLATL